MAGILDEASKALGDQSHTQATEDIVKAAYEAMRTKVCTKILHVLNRNQSRKAKKEAQDNTVERVGVWHFASGLGFHGLWRSGIDTNVAKNCADIAQRMGAARWPTSDDERGNSAVRGVTWLRGYVRTAGTIPATVRKKQYSDPWLYAFDANKKRHLASQSTVYRANLPDLKRSEQPLYYASGAQPTLGEQTENIAPAEARPLAVRGVTRKASSKKRRQLPDMVYTLRQEERSAEQAMEDFLGRTSAWLRMDAEADEPQSYTTDQEAYARMRVAELLRRLLSQGLSPKSVSSEIGMNPNYLGTLTLQHNLSGLAFRPEALVTTQQNAWPKLLQRACPECTSPLQPVPGPPVDMLPVPLGVHTYNIDDHTSEDDLRTVNVRATFRHVDYLCLRDWIVDLPHLIGQPTCNAGASALDEQTYRSASLQLQAVLSVYYRAQTIIDDLQKVPATQKKMGDPGRHILTTTTIAKRLGRLWKALTYTVRALDTLADRAAEGEPTTAANQTLRQALERVYAGLNAPWSTLEAWRKQDSTLPNKAHASHERIDAALDDFFATFPKALVENWLDRPATLQRKSVATAKGDPASPYNRYAVEGYMKLHPDNLFRLRNQEGYGRKATLGPAMEASCLVQRQAVDFLQ